MRRDKGGAFFYLKEITVGIVLSVLIIFGFFIYNNNILPTEYFLYETMPFYEYDSNSIVGLIFKLVPKDNINVNASDNSGVVNPSDLVSEVFSQNTPGQTSGGITKIEDIFGTGANGDVIGADGILYQSDDKTPTDTEHFNSDILTPYNIENLRKLEYLKQSFYTIDKTTELYASDIDVDKFLNTNLKIDNTSGGPKVLIFHTHMYEGFAGGDPANLSDGVYGAGERLASALKDKYGIESIHCTERFDVVNGAVQVLGAYERMEPVITKILDDNPSIEIAIDIHRDGVLDNVTKFVTEIDGKPTARIMFFNGLSRLKENGGVQELNNLKNPNQSANLAFSFQMQVAANERFPGFTRKGYLKAYRYSLHMLPKSLLVEIGTQNNTVEEALNSMDILAELLADVVLP